MYLYMCQILLKCPTAQICQAKKYILAYVFVQMPRVPVVLYRFLHRNTIYLMIFVNVCCYSFCLLHVFSYLHMRKNEPAIYKALY